MLIQDTKCPNCGTYHDPTLEKCPGCNKNNELFSLNRLPKRVLFLHPIVQIMMFLIGFAYAGMIVGEFIIAIYVRQIPGDDLIYKSLVMMCIVYCLMLFGLVTLVLSTRRKEAVSKFKNGHDYLFGLAYFGGLVLVSIFLGLIINAFFTAPEEINSNQQMADAVSKNYPIVSFILLGFVGPICEELTYRVGLYSFLRRINKYLAFVITCIVFAFIHIDFDSGDMIAELWSIPTYLVSGLILTIAYEHRGPACSITAHALYNLTAFLAVLMRK